MTIEPLWGVGPGSRGPLCGVREGGGDLPEGVPERLQDLHQRLGLLLRRWLRGLVTPQHAIQWKTADKTLPPAP